MYSGTRHDSHGFKQQNNNQWWAHFFMFSQYELLLIFVDNLWFCIRIPNTIRIHTSKNRIRSYNKQNLNDRRQKFTIQLTIDSVCLIILLIYFHKIPVLFTTVTVFLKFFKSKMMTHYFSFFNDRES